MKSVLSSKRNLGYMTVGKSKIFRIFLAVALVLSLVPISVYRSSKGFAEEAQESNIAQDDNQDTIKYNFELRGGSL